MKKIDFSYKISGRSKSHEDLINELVNNQNEIIAWINNYEGAKEKFRQKLLNGQLTGAKTYEAPATTDNGELGINKLQELANPEE
jgi:hypothetical protein